MRVTRFANARSIVSTLPARVPSSRYAASLIVMRSVADVRVAAGRQARAGGAVGDRHHPFGSFRRQRDTHHRGMDVNAVADDLGDDLFGFQTAPASPGARWVIGLMRLNKWVA